MKKLLAIALMACVMFTAFAQGGTEAAAPAASAKMKVGMVTDSGTIDDRSFNQGTYEGLEKAAKELGLEYTYLRPAGTTPGDYLTAISDLYDQGYRFVACPGFLFSSAVYEAQTQYPDLKLLILDSAPSDPKGNVVIKDNVLAISWKEQESGFLAGVATALQLKSGDVGFVGGIAVPAVQKFNWGFQQGVKYANEKYGTKISMKKENFVYSGSFSDLALGQQLATAMYDKGVKAIFACGGGTGVGVINEAKSRRLAGKDVWVIGVDVDQYAIGDMGNGKSAVLTSAMKYVDKAAYDAVKSAAKGTFKGGQNLMLGAATDDLGIPAENPNLSAEVQKEMKGVVADVKAGKISIQDNPKGLFE